MSETSDRLLRAYQEQEKRFVERRFPLQFAPEVPALRELYSQAKGFHWIGSRPSLTPRRRARRRAACGAGARGASIPG